MNKVMDRNEITELMKMREQRIKNGTNQGEDRTEKKSTHEKIRNVRTD